MSTGGQRAALWTSTSTCPPSASVAAEAKLRSTSGAAARSDGRNAAAPPSARMSATTASPLALSRPVTRTVYPWAARARAVAAPMPLVDPVTIAVCVMAPSPPGTADRGQGGRCLVTACPATADRMFLGWAMPADRAALGAFLRSRRDRITPAQAGITAFPGPRRVPGLRKEELAVLAGLSPDHYSRIEQGRQPTLSDDVLDALARALRLDDAERAHLRDLAAPAPRRAGRSTWEAPQQPDPGLLRLLTTLDHVPALLLGRRATVLARNGLLTAVLGTDLPPGSSFTDWLFLDQAARERIANWSDFAAAAVGAMRMELGRRPQDHKLRAAVQALRAADADVARWWADHGVTDRTSVEKQIAHPTAGPLTFGIEAVTTPHDPEQRLVVYTVQPDSPTARVLPLLAAWGSDHTEQAR